MKSDCEKFRFSQRTSVEHFYPQQSEDGNGLDDKVLNSFGNLSLLSQSENSRMTNRMPRSKAELYINTINNRKFIPTLKYHIMMNACYQNNKWDENYISHHEKDMIDIYKNELRNFDIKMD